MTSLCLDYKILKTQLGRHLPDRLHKSFNETLQSLQAVVAGSFSLYLVQSSTGNKPKWTPNDMDILIHASKIDSIESWFKINLGPEFMKLEPVFEKVMIMETPYDSNLFKAYHVRCRTHDTRLQVISVLEPNVKDFILHNFDLSNVMSFWDGNELGVYFLSQTKDCKMLQINRPSKSTPSRIRKYQNRGFTISDDFDMYHLHPSTNFEQAICIPLLQPEYSQ